MPPVLVYHDYIHGNGVLFRRLCRHYGGANVALCDARDILSGALDEARLLVMPGGADLYYCEKLNGAGNDLIRSFVEQGGAYLGICAGAYYAARDIMWAQDTPHQIGGSRALAFFPGTVTGPVAAFIEDGDVEKSWKNAVRIRFGEDCHTVLYDGGGLFTDDDTCDVLARYDDLPGRPAAIISCAVGKGMAILSSPHIEYDADSFCDSLYKHCNNSFAWEESVARRMKRAAPQTQDLLALVLDRSYKQ